MDAQCSMPEKRPAGLDGEGGECAKAEHGGTKPKDDDVM